MTSQMTLQEALDTIAKLQGAAPAPTAARLGQVAELLKQLSSDNAYLNSLLVDDLPQVVSASPVVVRPAPAANLSTAEVRTVTAMLRDSSEMTPMETLFTGMNEALRPPLIAIRGRAELVQAGLLGKITPEQDTWLQAIEENTDRAFAVLETVHEMMALQNGQAKIEQVNFISTDLLTEGWERIRDRAHQFKHDVSIQAPEVVPLAHGDFYQSLIVLTDLLDNAVRYTPPGGQIRMSVDNLGDHVLFSVADNGIGLTEEDLANIGKPFWRGDHHRLVRQQTGTGLRLALAKQILALQDGELIFSGEPDLGSTFSFTLRTP